jgi:hypothetical protein
MPIDAVSGRLFITIEEALERALREDPDNRPLFRSLWMAFEHGLDRDEQGYVAYERVRDICRRADSNWPDTPEPEDDLY